MPTILARSPLPLGIVLLAIAALSGRPVAAAIVINEIMYNAPGSADPAFVELHNTGPTPVSVDGWWLLDDDDLNTPCLLAGEIAPAGYLVIAESIATFQSAYPGAGPLNVVSYAAGQPGGGFLLGKGGDVVRLFDASGALVEHVPYDDEPPWPVEADGAGSSLERINPTLEAPLATSWAASPAANPPGSPGQSNASFDPDVPPRIDLVDRDPALPVADDDVRVIAAVFDDLDSPVVNLVVDLGAGYSPVAMFDDGVSDDGVAGNGMYGATIPAQPDATLVRYYVEATDGAAQFTRAPADAPASWFAYTVGHRPPRLVINELVASNQNGIVDTVGERDDWLEIRNAGVEPVDLGGRFLSNDPLAPRLWALPGIQLPPHGFALIWCDAEPEQGASHAPFRLPRSGGFVGLYDGVDLGNTLIASRRYAPQQSDISIGLLPEGAGRPEYIATPSPAAPNAGSAAFSVVRINEVLASSDVGAADFVELYNRGAAAVDIGGWFLSDDPSSLTRFPVPPGTVLPAQGVVAFDAAQLGFGFSAAGGEWAVLTAPDEVTVVDAIEIDEQLPDVSIGRLPDGGIDWHRFSAWTRELPNYCAPGAETPGAITGLRFATRDVLRWDTEPTAGAYDVVRGDLGTLRLAGGLDDAVCHENNVPEAATFAPDSVDGGTGLYYVVRGVTERCGFGSFSSGGPGESPGRDASVLSPDACP